MQCLASFPAPPGRPKGDTLTMSQRSETVAARLTLGPIRNPVRGFLHLSAAVVALAIAADLAGRSGLPPAERAILAGWPLCHFSLFLASALYHSAPWGPVAKWRMQRIDHAMIYVKIAGSGSAITWLTLDGAVRDGIVWVLWAIALAGAAQKTFFPQVHENASRPVQVFQACWVLPGLAAFPALFPGAPSAMLLAGGACYAVGALCFLLELPQLWPRVFSFHELFHVTTVLASALHVGALIRYLASP